jgi:hypothetical protein
MERLALTRCTVCGRWPVRRYGSSHACKHFEPSTVDQIGLDLPRTFHGNNVVQGKLHVVEDMLRRYCDQDRELGYVQGMNLVAAVFAAASHDFTEAYKRFYSFMRQVRGLWLPGFPMYIEGVSLFNSLASEKAWHRHLQSHMDPSMYLPQAWLGLFTRWLPFDTLVCCLDVFEEHGFAAMLATTVAVLDHACAALPARADLEALKEFFDDLEQRAPQENDLRSAIDGLLPRARALLRDTVEPQECTLAEAKLPDRSITQIPSGRTAQEQQLLDLLQMQKARLKDRHPFLWFTVGESNEYDKENLGKANEVLMHEEAVSDLLRCLGFDGVLI